MERLSWSEYGLVIAQAVATRSEDPWHKVGAVAFRADNSVAGVGYNGPPSGVSIDWALRDARHPFIIHAEVNALRWTTPIEVMGGWVATTREPCAKCLAAIAAHHIRRVIFIDENNEPSSPAGVFGIHLEQFNLDFSARIHLATWDKDQSRG